MDYAVKIIYQDGFYKWTVETADGIVMYAGSSWSRDEAWAEARKYL